MSTARDEDQPSQGRAEGRTVTAIFVGAQSSRCRDGQDAVVVVDGDRAEVAEHVRAEQALNAAAFPGRAEVDDGDLARVETYVTDLPLAHLGNRNLPAAENSAHRTAFTGGLKTDPVGDVVVDDAGGGTGVQGELEGPSPSMVTGTNAGVRPACSTTLRGTSRAAPGEVCLTSELSGSPCAMQPASSSAARGAATSRLFHRYLVPDVSSSRSRMRPKCPPSHRPGRDDPYVRAPRRAAPLRAGWSAHTQ